MTHQGLIYVRKRNVLYSQGLSKRMFGALKKSLAETRCNHARSHVHPRVCACARCCQGDGQMAGSIDVFARVSMQARLLWRGAALGI